MIISREHNFLFIHIQKAAGSSVREALQTYAEYRPKDRLSKIRSKMNFVNKDKPMFFPVHSSWNYAYKRLGAEQYENLFKFAFVRNPWDRIVSSYHYLLKNTKHGRHAKVKAFGSFAAYIDYEIKRNKFSQTSLLTDGKGNLKVDFVGKFENLSKDFDYVCEKIGIDASIPHINKSSHDKYTKLYDDELIEKVAHNWADEIALFDYSF